MRRNVHTRVGAWALGVALAGVVLAGSVLVGPASPASAHNSVISTTPAAGSVVTEQPGVFQLTTNDNLLNLDGLGGGMGMQISGPEGAASPLYYGDGCTTVFGPTLEMSAQLGEPGTYTVVWQVVSTDGHSISGDFSFTWAPDASQKLAAGVATAPNCGGTVAGGTEKTDAAATPAPAPGNAALGDVLWIGGAVAAVILATLVTVLVVSRRKPAAAPGGTSAAGTSGAGAPPAGTAGAGSPTTGTPPPGTPPADTPPTE
jgi:methionine-rich copper-binding protein CopC